MELDPADIRNHLAKLLASPLFSASPTSSRLIAYLVNETLAGRADRLKGYSIGVDVFDKNADFDAASDSIVRVQIGRLRKLLDDYYATPEGSGDRITFEIAKGSYEVQFVAATLANSATQVAKPVGLNWRRLAAWSLPAFAMVGAGAYFLIERATTVEERIEPKVFVAQYNSIDSSAETALITKGLQHDLITLLSQYPNLAVFGYETVSGEGDGRAISDVHGADYILGGSVTTGGGRIKVSSELTSVRTGLVVWSTSKSLSYDDVGDVLQSQSDIALSVGPVLGQPDGVIQQASKALVGESKGVSFANYACILSTYDYKRRKGEGGHRKIRTCLEQVTRDNPNYSSAWSLLSWVYGDEYRYGFNSMPQQSSADRALQAAETGVSTNPFSATAHQYLSIAQFYLGRDAEARRSIETALRLGPNNSEILADAGWQHALTGDDDKARYYFDEAIKLNPDPPSWYWGGLAIDAIRNDDAERAMRFAELYTGDGVLSLYTLAAAHRLNGDEKVADKLVGQIALRYSGYDQPDSAMFRRHRIDAKFSRWIFRSD